MFGWLNGPGENFRHPLPNSTNYLSAYDRRGNLLRQADSSKNRRAPSAPTTSDSQALEDAAVENKLEKENREDLRPFPLNQHFVSQSVLSEQLRQEIWRRVKVDGKSVRTVSVEMGVEMRRVGAVVRLVEVERRMRAEKAPLALPYARAVHSMVPTTPYNPQQPARITPHEPINDLPSHYLTEQQLFYPTSESRQFNRVDAGRVFSAAPRLPDDMDIGQGGNPGKEMWQDTDVEIVGKRGKEMPVLKPADSRIPHPHLIAFEKDKKDPKLAGEVRARTERYAQRLLDDEKARADMKMKRAAQEEAQKTRIETSRWEFIVKEVRATRDGTGLDGRGTGSPGYRYGVPSQDRKRGQVKIPTRVEV